MGNSRRDSRKKYVRVSHNRRERNHCRINAPELLNQVMSTISFLTASIGVLKREELEQRIFFPKKSEIIGLSPLSLWRERERGY